MNKLKKIIGKFNSPWIGVIGDIMSDHFIWGDTERISPEAPVPIVKSERETFLLGGAANTANNLRALGAKVFLVGVLGQDQAGKRLIKQLKEKNIKFLGIQNKNYMTTQKIRVISRGQQVVRIDREKVQSLDNESQRKLLSQIKKHINSWDALIISDYLKGVLTCGFAKKIIKLAREAGVYLLLDSKNSNIHHFMGVDLFVPNESEALKVASINNVKKAGKAIQQKIDCNVVVTQGEKGMTLFSKNKVKSFPVKKVEVYDVSGAGDTVAATLATAISVGASLEEAIRIANLAGAISVSKTGTAVVTQKELIDKLE